VRLAALVLVAFAPPVGASVARSISFEEKVREADRILLARCTGSRSAWDAERRWILTYSTFQVEKTLKGAAVPEITVVTPGGQVGSLHQETVGVPDFSAGQQKVLFVKQGAVGPTILHLEQGAYDVAADQRGDLFVRPVSSSLVLVDSQTGRASAPEPVRSLKSFEQDVRAAVARHRETAQRYGVAPSDRPEKSAGSPLADFVKGHRVLLSLLVLAIALSTYLLIKNR